MPYLQRPRLHFAGRFTANVSTYNNTDSNFQTAGFNPNAAPAWNPGGTGDFSFTATVTAVCYEDGTTATTPQQDAIVGTTVTGMAPNGSPGKLVDLDPDQQQVSQIWCLQVSVGTAISGKFTTAPFTDIWNRMPGAFAMTAAGAFYQSQLAAPALTDPGNSRFFTELNAAAGGRPLSIRFNVDAFVWESSNAQYFPTGRVVGTIGATQPNEPQHVTLGRQLFSASMLTDGAFGNGVAIVDRTAGRVIFDLGNMLPIGMGPGDGSPGPMIDHGPITFGTAAQPAVLGTLPSATYTDPNWYAQTAGIVDLPIGNTPLIAAQLDVFENTALQVSAGGSVIALEENGGQWVRADDFVYRMSPGDTRTAMIYATSFGKPLANASIVCALDPGTLASSPAKGFPALPVTVTTDANGVAQLTFTAGDAGAPRQVEDIDGQVYAIRATLQALGSAAVVNPSDFISVLLWNAYQVPAVPTWWHDAQPILQQFANLYPVMKQQGLIDLGDYASVAGQAGSVKFVLSRPSSDPNFMPVTRDLSPAKTQMLLAWLATTGGPGGGPNEGTQPSHLKTVLAGAAHAAHELAAHARAAVTHRTVPRRTHEDYHGQPPHKKHEGHDKDTRPKS